MSNTVDLESKLNELKAIPSEKVMEPNVPMDTYLQEVDDLYHWASDDKQALAGAGISEELFNDLPVRIGAGREAQSLWNKDFRSTEQAVKSWKELSPEAYALRDELLHALRFAFRNNSELLGRVTAIAEGEGHADMIQDLNDLAVLGRENGQLLSAINFDNNKLDTAASNSSVMADLLAQANGSRAVNNQSKDLRDRAYTHLKELADNIRACGKYIFWRNPERLKGYQSRYWKQKKQKKAPTDSATE